MRVGVIVLCRYNSSRLPGKILIDIHGKPVLAYILERLGGSRLASEIVVATSDQPADDPIEAYCNLHDVPVFRGSLDNVSQRFADCSRSFAFEYAVRINGDNLFTDTRLVDHAIGLATNNGYDLVSNVDRRTYPSGMSVEVVRTAFYDDLIRHFDKPEHFEHVTSYIYAHADAGRFHFFYNEEFRAAHRLKLALDCEDDLNFVSLLIQKMKKPHTEYAWEDIVKMATHD